MFRIFLSSHIFLYKARILFPSVQELLKDEKQKRNIRQKREPSIHENYFALVECNHI